MKPDKLYRYYEFITSGIPDEEYFTTSSIHTKVELATYDVMKKTLSGAWIRYWTKTGKSKKFVNLKAKKKFACPTQEEALESFKKRKKRQIQILEQQLEVARTALNVSESIKTENENEKEKEKEI
jgi:hypothetical protein